MEQQPKSGKLEEQGNQRFDVTKVTSLLRELRQQHEQDPHKSISVAAESMKRVYPEFLERIEGFEGNFLREELLDSLKKELHLSEPQKFGPDGQVGLYEVEPSETQTKEGEIRLPQGVRSHFVEVLRDDRNGRIIDITVGYPFFERVQHYGK